MEIKDRYWVEGTVMAAEMDLSRRLKEQGYSVWHDYKLGKMMVDLYAEKGDERLIYEFKAGAIGRDTRAQLEFIRKEAKLLGIKFQLVMVQVPKPKKIEIEGIERAFYENFVNDIPSELDSLSTHTLIEEVESVEVSSIKVKEDGRFNIKGKGEVTVKLVYDTDFEEGSYMSFPFEFEATAVSKSGVEIEEIEELRFELSKYQR